MSAFRHRNYRLFFGGQLVSLVGTWIQTVAQSWLVYRLTGSALLLGLVSFAAQLPVFLLATVGGAFADRIDRRRVLLVTQSSAMILALVLAALTLSGRVRTEHVFVIAALAGIVNAFDMPARSAFVADMVGAGLNRASAPRAEGSRGTFARYVARESTAGPLAPAATTSSLQAQAARRRRAFLR